MFVCSDSVMVDLKCVVEVTVKRWVVQCCATMQLIPMYDSGIVFDVDTDLFEMHLGLIASRR